VLTIFEYLRKLARESVLSGVQDAVEYLGGKAGGSQRTVEDQSPSTNSETAPPAPPRFNAQNYLAGPRPAPNGQPDDLPPPRRRGRPPRSGESA
jgi:hypothetical protein